MQLKKWYIWMLMMALAVLLVPTSLPAHAVPVQPEVAPPEYVPGELLVKFRQTLEPALTRDVPRTGIASVDALLQRTGATTIQPVFPHSASSGQGLNRIYKVTFAPDVDVLATAGALAADADIEYVEPNYLFRITDLIDSPAAASAVDDPYFNQQWYLNNTGQTGGTPNADIDAPEAWEISTGTNDIRIAVVDSGVDYDHPDLDDGRVQIDLGKDFAYNEDDVMDDILHGTYVAGLIAAETDNAAGIAGVMWQAQIVPIKVVSRDGVGTSDTIAQGISYAADTGADIINLSLGGRNCSQIIADAINYAYFDKGAVLVASAGNDNTSVSFPAGLDPVIAVGAVDHDDRKAAFSNYGEQIDVVAPGVDILSTVLDGAYETYSGTSAATPLVVGVIGLLKAQRPDLTGDQVRAILHASADDLGPDGFDPEYGYGRVNAGRALRIPTPSAPSPPAPAECSGCAVTTALLDSPAREEVLGLLRNFQSEVLITSTAGQDYNDLFYKHSPEVTIILFRNPDLRAQVQQTLAELSPVVEALTGAGPDVVITAEMVAPVAEIVEALAEAGSPELRRDLRAVWQAIDPGSLVGWNASDAWRVAINAPERDYLPLLER